MQKSIFKSDNDEDCDVWCGLFWMLLQSFEFEYLNTNMNMIKDRRCYCDIWGKYLISNTNIKKHGKDFDFDADYFEWGCRIWRNFFFNTWKTLEIETQILTKMTMMRIVILMRIIPSAAAEFEA